MSTTCYELSQHQHEASKLVPLTSSFKCCPLLQNCLHRHSVAFRPQISLFASLLKFLLLLLPSTGSALSSMWRSRHQLSLTLNETMNLLRHSQRLILRSSLRDSHSSNSISCCRSLARRQKPCGLLQQPLQNPSVNQRNLDRHEGWLERTRDLQC